MTYGDHVPFLSREIETLGSRPFALPFATILRVLEHRGSAEVDAACRTFASTLHWPPLEDHQRLEACLRLACTKWWCELNRTVDVEDGDEGEAFLTSLMIDYYKDVGREDWLYEWVGLKSTKREPPHFHSS
jgi:hypothetical protein